MTRGCISKVFRSLNIDMYRVHIPKNFPAPAAPSIRLSLKSRTDVWLTANK